MRDEFIWVKSKLTVTRIRESIFEPQKLYAPSMALHFFMF